jgi:hypothetical protein
MAIDQYTLKSKELRFLKYVSKGAPSECWPWIGAIGNAGYGVFSVNRQFCGQPAHRISYELYVGPIPDDLELDHTCHDPKTCKGGIACPHRRCVNPNHLAPVTSSVNSMRAYSAEREQTHCLRGHVFDEANTLYYKGGRFCRECKRVRRRLNAVS